MILEKSEIVQLELETTTVCNLKCPLCIRENIKYDKNKHRPFQELKDQINEFVNLKFLRISSALGEPLLYPHILDLIDFVQKRNISIEIYSNADVHNENWWKEFGLILGKNDEITFTVCGSTQELHEKYRVGSNLKNVINNIMAYKSNNKYNNDIVNYITFQYNAHDDTSYFNQFNFSSFNVINTAPFNEYIWKNSDFNDFNMPISHHKAYNSIMNKANKHELKIVCPSMLNGSIQVDINGKYCPCDLYKISGEEFNLDYTDINNGKFDFCKECNIKTQKYLKIIDMEECWL